MCGKQDSENNGSEVAMVVKSRVSERKIKKCRDCDKTKYFNKICYKEKK